MDADEVLGGSSVMAGRVAITAPMAHRPRKRKLSLPSRRSTASCGAPADSDNSVIAQLQIKFACCYVFPYEDTSPVADVRFPAPQVGQDKLELYSPRVGGFLDRDTTRWWPIG